MRRLGAVWGAVLLLSACAACAGGSHDAPPEEATTAPMLAAYVDAVRSAVAASRDTSALVNETIVITDKGLAYRFTLTGSFDMAADRGAVTIRFPGGAVDRMDEVFDGDAVYVRGPQNLHGKWVGTVRDEAVAHYLLRAPLNDPEFVLQQIAGMERVSKGEPARIDGALATHYSGVLDRKALTLRMAANVRDGLPSDEEGGWLLTADADVWLDGAGRVVRTRTSANLQGMGVTATMTLSGIGRPVTVTVPTPAAAVPATSFSGVLPG